MRMPLEESLYADFLSIDEILDTDENSLKQDRFNPRELFLQNTQPF